MKKPTKDNQVPPKQTSKPVLTKEQLKLRKQRIQH
jgi:hypothetical protein